MANEIEILVVDDDLAAAKSFAELIENKLKIKTGACSNADEVLSIIRTGTIKVVVLDEIMPEMNGTELFRKIQNINHYVKALLLTGEADVADIIKATKLGYSDYLQKSKIAELPGKVMVAYTQYEIGLSEQCDKDIKLSVWSPTKNGFGLYRYFVSSVELVSKEFYFEDGWQTKLELDSSEQVQDISYEYTEECIVKYGTEFKQSTSFGFQMGKLTSLKDQLDAVVTGHIDSSISSTLKTSKKITQTYRLQEGVESGKQAVKKVFERTPVYYKFELLLKKQCRFCNNTRILPIEVYKRIPKVATRETIYYTDSTKQVIDTGLVSIN